MSNEAIKQRSVQAMRSKARKAFDDGIMSPGQRFWYGRRKVSGNLANRVSSSGEYTTRPTTVYVVASQCGYVKIGISRDVEKRILTINTGLPFEVEFVCRVLCDTEQDARFIEYMAHKTIKRFHSKGEWFLCQRETATKAVKYAIEKWKDEMWLQIRSTLTWQ